MLLGNNRFPQDPRVRREAEVLQRAGYDVTVICRRGEGQPRAELVDGVTVLRYWNPWQPTGSTGVALEWAWSTLGCLALSLGVLLRRGFDVVHAHNPPDLLVVVTGVYRLLGKRVVFDHHDLAPEMYEARSGRGSRAFVAWVLRRLEWLSCRVAHHVIATNGSYRAVEIERDGVAPDCITIVRNGPGLAEQAPAEPDPELRARSGTIVGYLGVIGPQDGLDHLLRAMRHLVYDLGVGDALAVIIGRGESIPMLRRLATDLDIERNVEFTGHLRADEFAPLLCTADICVVPDPRTPYNDRSTMLKLMDYMALGRPVVAFDLTEHRVTAGDAAVYVEPGDDLALARAIVELMNDPDRRLQLGKRGRHRVETSLAWEHSAPQLLHAYATVLHATPRQDGRTDGGFVGARRGVR
jgi:glycosyltransferase involved in cell wall biosynthesis